MLDVTSGTETAKEHILVVEDDRDLRESLCEALELEGYAVAAVEHGEAALRYLTSGRRPCLILLDLMMPVMDGWTLRRELLKDPVLATIPVVIMTAIGQGRAAAVDSAAILHKPLEMDGLVSVIQTYCPDGATSGGSKSGGSASGGSEPGSALPS